MLFLLLAQVRTGAGTATRYPAIYLEKRIGELISIAQRAFFEDLWPIPWAPLRQTYASA